NSDSDGDSSEDEYDADWHDFALSEHTTSPQEGPIVEGETIRLCSVPTTAGGITIRETEPTIRPAGPACKPGDKGKGVLLFQILQKLIVMTSRRIKLFYFHSQIYPPELNVAKQG
ncbi:predicted protein, partial [Arabidopsis lyrata subsp. lyrata]